MKFLYLLPCIVFTVSSTAADVEDNCEMCHDTAPISADHMEVDAISVEECFMCHEAAGDDDLFPVIHTAHEPEDVGCDSCHATEPDKAELNKILGK